MKRSERLSAILNLLAEHGSVEVDDLIERLRISPATARRDLDALAEQQLLTRTHGGAVPHSVAYDLPLRYRSPSREDSKAAIARKASALVQRGEVVGLCGGTTTTAIADALMARADVQERGADHGLTVVTNALNIAMALASRPQIKTVLTGGVLHTGSYEIVGTFADIVLNGMNLDWAFLGADGIDESGATTVDEREASVNHLMAMRATTPVIVVDSGKIGIRAFARIGDHTTIRRVITDRDITPEQLAMLEGAGYEVTIAD